MFFFSKNCLVFLFFFLQGYSLPGPTWQALGFPVPDGLGIPNPLQPQFIVSFLGFLSDPLQKSRFISPNVTLPCPTNRLFPDAIMLNSVVDRVFHPCFNDPPLFFY